LSLAHAILGLLNYEAMTGYDLKRRWFDRSLRFFWPADQAQIYRTLDTLVGREWASFVVEPGDDRPNRKVYSLTDAGRVELDRWLTTPQPLPAVRDPLMVQLFSAEHLTDDEITHLLTSRRAAHLARQAEYAQVQAWLPEIATGRRLKLWLAVVGTGLAEERAAIAWLDQLIAEFNAENEATPPAVTGPNVMVFHGAPPDLD
jgi:DNA-binding PadR family transcriptional regulator